MGYMAVVERNPAEMRYQQQLMVKAGSKYCAECLQALETRGGAESGTVRFVNSTAHPSSNPGDCGPGCACPPRTGDTIVIGNTIGIGDRCSAPCIIGESVPAA